MPLHAERPIVRVEHSSMRTIETRNTENLFGLWSGEWQPVAPQYRTLTRPRSLCTMLTRHGGRQALREHGLAAVVARDLLLPARQPRRAAMVL